MSRQNPYVAHDWNTGDTITEERLDSIENGVQLLDTQIGELYDGLSSIQDKLLKNNDSVYFDNITVEERLQNMFNALNTIENNSNAITGWILSDTTDSSYFQNVAIEGYIKNLSNDLTNIHSILSGMSNVEETKTELYNYKENLKDNLQYYTTNTLMPELEAVYSSAAEEAVNASNAALAAENARDAALEITSAIEEMFTSAETVASSTAENVAQLTISEVIGNITAAFGSSYYDEDWETIDDVLLKSVSDRLNDLESAVGSNGEGDSLASRISNLETLVGGDGEEGETLVSQIEALQEYLGLEESVGSTSLIDKIEGAIGRSLSLEQDEEISSGGEYSNSIMSHIYNLEDILGVNSQSSDNDSNLIEVINDLINVIYGNNNDHNLGDNFTLSKVLDDLYGELEENSFTSSYERSENPLINTLKSLPTSFNTLSTRVGAIEQDNLNIHTSLTSIESWEDIVNQAYTDADIRKYDDTSYLRLIRDSTVNWPATVADMANETKNTYIELPAGGGGGASGGGTAIITRITDASIQVLVNNTCNISYKLEARDTSNELVGNGNATWFVGGVQVATSTALNIISNNDTTTINTFDISPYLTVGSNNITLQIVVNTGGENATIVRKTWTVNVINFSLLWSYNEETIFDNGIISLSWIPYGAGINKTSHIVIDNEEVYTSTTVQSGITQTYSFEHSLTHGVHTCEIYLTATINGQSERTVSQYHDLIVVLPGNTLPIISSSPVAPTMEQYDTIAIPVVIYTPNSTLTSNAVLAENGTTVDTWTNIDRKLHYWNYSPLTTGEKTLTITVGTVTKTITITVESININNQEVAGYDFKIKASEIISNEGLRNNQLLTFSNNFDWINGGIKSEKDSNNIIQQYICIKAGTTMTINKQLFNSELANGLNFKIIMKITNCSDYDTKILDCYANDIGIQLFAHKGALSSSSRTITTQYGENTYIELEFEVYNSDATTRYMMCWVDGVMSVARVCNNTDKFKQTNETNIVIGSNNCDVNIYLIKNYYKKLSINEHITNFIADAPNATTMKARYNRNDVIGDDDEIDYEKLYDASPDCRIWLYDIHRMTTGKKDQVQVYEFQQLWKSGGKEYYDGLIAKNAILTVQGTSSVNYRKGAANTDINFSGDNCTLKSASGEDLLAEGLAHKGMKLTNTSTPITYSNMKVNFASCEQVNNMCNAYWYQNFQPYPSLSSRDCMEFVMGVQFIKDRGLDEPVAKDPTTGVEMQEVPLFSEKNNRNANKYYMYSIGNLGTSKKNTDIFHSENECCIEVTDNTTAGQRMIAWPQNGVDWAGAEDNGDHSYEMRYPETKTPNSMITTGWERFVKWMANNNPNAATNETIPEETYPIYTFKGHHRSGTQILQGTTVSQYAGTYTTDSFNRRMAKMLSECEDYMAMDSVVYHFCFIERHTMVDNVAKNTFWSAAKTNQYINGVEQEDTEGYWIWDLSKNYDNDTSDGNNNEGQLVFDYGNEANDSINGKMVFNASDSVWFVFISNLKEACATMFINRESATSNDGKFVGAWNSLSYHNFLLEQQQKIPERVWNECYWYDYLRTYENNIDRSWISFLDGGQKIQQRRHYETFQETYLASKYMSPRSIGDSITMRGYTPQITENMDEEQRNIINTTLSVVPSKSEVTVTMYNKCYLTVHMGNNFLQQKVAKGVPTTLTFREKNGSYLGLNDTVINIDTASMIQEIGDLSPLYPGQSSFGAAYRLKSIKIGSALEGYQNLNISATETGAFDFSTNRMLERLEIQNLKAVNAPLSLNGCPALKYLDASGSSFTGYSFADGGLLTTVKLGNPNTIIMTNLSYLEDNNFIIDSTSNLKYLTIDNCPLIDTFNRSQQINNLLTLDLLNVNWQVQGIDFDSFVTFVKTIPSYLITGKVILTPEMGSFSVGTLGNTFTKDLKFYYYDSNSPEDPIKPYYTVTFYGLNGEFIRNYYVPKDGTLSTLDFSNYFTATYLNNYNLSRNPSWVDGDDSRYSFGYWADENNIVFNESTIISSDKNIYAKEGLEYKMIFVIQTSEGVDQSSHSYYKVGERITRFTPPSFVKNYYKYFSNDDWWTTLDNRVADYFEDEANITKVSSSAVKAAEVETWYAAYMREPQNYKINLYNTNINGEPVGDSLTPSNLMKPVLGSNNKIYPSDISAYLPINNSNIYMAGEEGEEDANKSDSERQYRFLTVRPFIPTTGLQMTGEMNLYITYYNKDDVFTNYFLNKLTVCDLRSNVNTLPPYSFNHNTNLEKLYLSANKIGDYSFIGLHTPLNANDASVKRYFVLTANDVEIGNKCFNHLKNAVIIFTGTGNFRITRAAFDQLEGCIIILLNTDNTLICDDINTSFYNFTLNSSGSSQNVLYVTHTAYNKYPTTTGVNQEVPVYLISSNRNGILDISDLGNKVIVNQHLRAVNLPEVE